MPKDYEESREQAHLKTKTQGWGHKKVSIVITKPKLTINGFKNDDVAKETIKNL